MAVTLKLISSLDQVRSVVQYSLAVAKKFNQIKRVCRGESPN